MAGELTRYSERDILSDGSIDYGNSVIGPSSADLIRADYVASLLETPKNSNKANEIFSSASSKDSPRKTTGRIPKLSPALASVVTVGLFACSATGANNSGQQVNPENIPSPTPYSASVPIETQVHKLISEGQQYEQGWTTYHSLYPNHNYEIKIPPGWTGRSLMLGNQPYDYLAGEMRDDYNTIITINSQSIPKWVTLEDFANNYLATNTSINNEKPKFKETKIDGMKTYEYSYKEQSSLGFEDDNQIVLFLAEGRGYSITSLIQQRSNQDKPTDYQDNRQEKTLQEFEKIRSTFKIIPK